LNGTNVNICKKNERQKRQFLGDIVLGFRTFFFLLAAMPLNSENANFFGKIERQKRQLDHPWKKIFVIEIGKNDTGLGSLLSPWKNWFHGHWKKNQIVVLDPSCQWKKPPDIEKTTPV
jgi:hypothetical protein